MIYLSTLMALEHSDTFFDALHKAGPQLGAEIFSFRYDKEEIAQLKKLIISIKEHPMTFHGPMRSAELTEKRGSVRYDQTMDAYKRAFGLAEAAQATHMVVHTHEVTVEACEKYARMQCFEENIHALSAVAREFGIQLSIENVSPPGKGVALYDENEYISLIIRLQECAALIDVGHVHCTGWDLERMCKSLRGRVSGFHLHNNDGYHDSHAWLRDGTMNVERALQIIAQYGKRADLILEYGDTNGKTADDLLHDVRLLPT